MINKVTLIGRLGADPEVRRLEGGAVVSRFSLATSESYKDKDGNFQETTEWHNVVAWRELAERAERSLKKGMLVYVEGKISYRKYTDQNNQDRYVTDIVAFNMRQLEKREGGGNPNERNFPAEEPARFANSGTSNVEPAPAVEMAVAGDGNDLPF
jgi:single-strand DNA-binding protein